MSARSNISMGRLIASVLTGAWRESPPIPDLTSATLGLVAEKLLIARAGALAWWKVRRTRLRSCPEAQELYNAYLLFTLKAALHERNVEAVFTRLRAAGVEPILIKGWSIARLYPEPALRPYGDIDLCVSRKDFARAREVLKSPDGRTMDVDLLHDQMGRLGNRSWEEFHPRTQLVRLGETQVRVLGEEDQLRVLCMHMLKGPRMSPVLLCDIALMIERLRAGFDWELCWEADRSRTG